MFDVIYRYDPAQNVRRLPADAEEALRRLEEGNQEFASILGGASGLPATGSRILFFDPEDLGVAPEGGHPRQQPFAAVVGCSDARVPTELIFNRACNELFVVRVAGNILGQEGMGSIDYAVEHLGADLHLLVVLGHSHCGAVTAAADAFLRPADYLALAPSHTLRAVINNILPAVRAAAAALVWAHGDGVERLAGYRDALIETAIVFNAALTADMLRQEFAGAKAQDRRVAFGVYDLATRRVGVPLDPASPDPTPGLVEPPQGRDGYRAFAQQVIGSACIRRLLPPTQGEGPSS